MSNGLPDIIPVYEHSESRQKLFVGTRFKAHDMYLKSLEHQDGWFLVPWMHFDELDRFIGPNTTVVSSAVGQVYKKFIKTEAYKHYQLA